MNKPFISFDLTGRVAIVTGGSYGIGIEMTTSLAEYGADVAILARGQERREKTAKEIAEKTGRKIVPFYCDVADENSVKEAVDAVLKEFGRIDILVNNAGIIEINPPETHTMEQWQKVIDIDLTGTFLMCKEVFNRYMKEHGGRIVNFASVSAFTASGNCPSYNAAKAGVVHLTKTLAVSFAPYGVYVNAIAPGQMTNGEMAGQTPQDVLDRIVQKIPQGRVGQYGDLSGALLFLASDACSFTHGQTIVCDGGCILGM